MENKSKQIKDFEKEITSTNLIIPNGFSEAYKKRKDYPKIKKILKKIKKDGR